MSQPSIPVRVEILEKKMTSLDGLPERVDSLVMQIAQFRDEVRAEFSAIRTELSAKATREEVRDLAATLRTEMHACEERLRTEIRAGDDETRRFMRVLHEDLIARITVMGEAKRPGRKGR